MLNSTERIYLIDYGGTAVYSMVIVACLLGHMVGETFSASSKNSTTVPDRHF